MAINNKRLFLILSISVTLLLVPIIAMQFNDAVKWDSFDFVIAGVLLLGTGLIFELIMRKVKKRNSRIAICMILMILFFLIFVELAVGVFGTLLSGN